jgi:hypothetical protein
MHGRLAESAKWYEYLGKSYPEANMLDYDTNSLPSKITVDEYAVYRVQGDVSETMDRNRIKAIIEGMLASSFENLVQGKDELSAGLRLMAEKILETYHSKTSHRQDALRIDPIEVIQQEVLTRMLDPQNGVPPELRAALREKLGLEPEPPAVAQIAAPAAPPATTNSAPPAISTK